MSALSELLRRAAGSPIWYLEGVMAGVKRTISRRVSLFLGIAALLVVSSVWTRGAQQPGPSRTPANPAYFTGNAFTLDTVGVRLSRNAFDAGARANWHVHAGNQLVFVQEGAMRAQVEGQPMKELRQGESVLLPVGVPHWHGAAPDQAATQVGVSFEVGAPKVMEKVTDAQYAGKAGRR